MHSEPFVEIFTLRKDYREPQVPRSLDTRVVSYDHRRVSGAILTKVASAYFLSWYCLVPSGTSLRGLKVRVLALQRRQLKKGKFPLLQDELTSQRRQTSVDEYGAVEN
jgi:hypothetical protein